MEKGIVRRITEAGHEIGSHGHQHICFKEKWRAEQDKETSQEYLDTRLYRAPKFYHARQDSIYSNPKGHYSLLKNMWLGQTGTIFYMHPFDIVKSPERPPNLFCKLWYSRPDWALNRLETIIENLSRQSSK